MCGGMENMRWVLLVICHLFCIQGALHSVGKNAKISKNKLDKYSATPFGYAWKQCMHHVENFAEIIDTEPDKVIVISPNGSKEEFPRCKHPAIPLGKAKIKRIFFDAEGWQVYASFNNANNQSFDSFLGNWNVPHAPAYWPWKDPSEQHVIYLFTALQSDNWVPNEPPPPSGFDIIQPVLQYGNSDPNGGGAYWALASWYLTLTGDTFYSDLLLVSEGDMIFGNMTRVQGNKWYIGSTLLKNGNTTGLTASNPRLQVQPWAYVTLEVYEVNTCSEFPDNSITFSDLKLVTQGQQTQPVWTPLVGQQVCTENITIASHSQITINF